MSLSRQFAVIFGLLFSVLASLAQSAGQDEAVNILMEMTQAHKNLNYQGTFVYISNGRLESMQVTHAADSQGERERLVHLNGSAREVIRHNDISTCILPDDAMVIVERHPSGNTLSPILSGDVKDFQDSYEITLDGEERIAGLLATRIAIRPKDQYRYGYRLWVSSDHRLLLKSALLNEQGEVIEQFMFTDVKVVGAVPEAMLQSKIDAHNFKWYQQEAHEAETVAEDQRWTVMGLPQGFHLISYNKQRSPHGGNEVDHILLSDGLASVSVFIEKLEPQMEQRVGASKMGAVNAYAMLYNGYQVIVVGDVPVLTAQMMAQATRIPGGEDYD